MPAAQLALPLLVINIETNTAALPLSNSDLFSAAGVCSATLVASWTANITFDGHCVCCVELTLDQNSTSL